MIIIMDITQITTATDTLITDTILMTMVTTTIMIIRITHTHTTRSIMKRLCMTIRQHIIRLHNHKRFIAKTHTAQKDRKNALIWRCMFAKAVTGFSTVMCSAARQANASLSRWVITVVLENPVQVISAHLVLSNFVHYQVQTKMVYVIMATGIAQPADV